MLVDDRAELWEELWEVSSHDRDEGKVGDPAMRSVIGDGKLVRGSKISVEPPRVSGLREVGSRRGLGLATGLRRLRRARAVQVHGRWNKATAALAVGHGRFRYLSFLIKLILRFLLY